MSDAGIGSCPRCKVADDVTSVTIEQRILARCWACGHLWSESETNAINRSPGQMTEHTR
jgi:phage FluMu protein Com